MSDLGAIGILRKLYLENLDLNHVCELYWGSRREIGNPNFESLLGQLLINISASIVYDLIKLLYESGVITEQWLALRRISATAGFLSPAQLLQVFEHTRLLLSLYRLKQEPSGIDSASKFVRDTLAGDLTSTAETSSAPDAREFELILANMRVIARAVVIDSVRETGHAAIVPAGGLTLSGLPASSGVAWGKPITALEYLSSKPTGDFIIAIDSNQLDADSTVMALHRGLASITSDTMTGHVSVLARGIGKPCVAAIDWRAQKLENFSFAIVDGGKGIVRLFVQRPTGYPESKSRYYKYGGD